MQAYEVLGVTHDGEAVCWDCMTEEERQVANDEIDGESLEIHPIFASEEGEFSCGRCLDQIKD